MTEIRKRQNLENNGLIEAKIILKIVLERRAPSILCFLHSFPEEPISFENQLT